MPEKAANFVLKLPVHGLSILAENLRLVRMRVKVLKSFEASIFKQDAVLSEYPQHLSQITSTLRDCNTLQFYLKIILVHPRKPIKYLHGHNSNFEVAVMLKYYLQNSALCADIIRRTLEWPCALTPFEEMITLSDILGAYWVKESMAAALTCRCSLGRKPVLAY